MSISVADLVSALPSRHEARLIGPGEGRLVDATLDSREVQPGWVFIARPGAHADGHDFIPAAIANGASCVVVDRELDLPIAQILVRNVAQVVGDCAAAIHGYPAQSMTVIGVTGTNGKTTTTTLIHHIAREAGLKAGLIGTVETRIGSKRIDGVRTTPEATDMHRLLARMREADIDLVAMEVSSHGIDLGRINGLVFDAVGFTNLSQDHLDYHLTMEAYAQVKAQLFHPARARSGWVVLGDPEDTDTQWSDYVYQQISLQSKTISQYQPADVYITDVRLGAASSAFTMVEAGERQRVQIPMPGRFNIDNAVLALCLARAAGIEEGVAIKALAQHPGVSGRAEVVTHGRPGPTVVVDYAHTPDAVENVLASMKASSQGRTICVLGCGGDRDREKRPRMADAALTAADWCVFTSDNPRSEDPEAILDDMTRHLLPPDQGGRWERITDRRAAIRHAILMAHPEDTVVLAGKGHETDQEIRGVFHHFDDREEARHVLEEYHDEDESAH